MHDAVHANEHGVDREAKVRNPRDADRPIIPDRLLADQPASALRQDQRRKGGREGRILVEMAEHCLDVMRVPRRRPFVGETLRIDFHTPSVAAGRHCCVSGPAVSIAHQAARRSPKTSNEGSGKSRSAKPPAGTLIMPGRAEIS